MEIARKLDILKEVLSEQAEEERWLSKKHPWFGVLMNLGAVVLMLIVLVSSVVYRIQNNVDERVDNAVESAKQTWQEEQVAIQQEEQKKKEEEERSIASVIERESDDLAKMFFGIRNFEEKYGYSEKDFETYARCAFNRSDATGKSLHDVVFEKDQFLACSESNQIINKYKTMAKGFLETWHSEKTKPVDNSYQFAELRPDGVWLTNVFGADGYARRWRA